jgi:hypothetical protein
MALSIKNKLLQASGKKPKILKKYQDCLSKMTNLIPYQTNPLLYTILVKMVCGPCCRIDSVDLTDGPIYKNF